MVSRFEPTQCVINEARSFGFQQLFNGTTLYGHVPHVGTEAWLHQLHAPLTVPNLASLAEQIGQTFLGDLREFYLSFSNGAHLFSGSLSIFGQRKNYARSGDDARQPFCLITSNTIERPSRAKPWQIIVAAYQWDGSLTHVDSRDGTVFRTKGRSTKILNRWTSFSTMLNDETARLSQLFDERGRPRNGEPTTPPPDV
jgi:hypothetical protein